MKIKHEEVINNHVITEEEALFEQVYNLVTQLNGYLAPKTIAETIPHSEHISFTDENYEWLNFINDTCGTEWDSGEKERKTLLLVEKKNGMFRELVRIRAVYTPGTIELELLDHDYIFSVIWKEDF